jgi:hypothetical protein
VWPFQALLGANVNDILAPIAKKLAAPLRLLSSNRDGDVIAAGRAIIRMLKGVGADIHALAERIEKPSAGGRTNAEMKKLYDAGYAAGTRDAEQHGNIDFHNVDGTPERHEIARFCQQHSDRLRMQEKTFVNEMASQTVWREPTEKHAKWLRSIFHRLGGRI